MSHYRSNYRTIVRTAVTGSAAFTGVKVLSAWVQNISADDLPVLGVATPIERKERDSLDSSARETVLKVVLKRLGGDTIEDTLDADSQALETLIEAAFTSASVAAVLEETSIEVDGAGDRRVGSLVLTFRVSAFLAEPLTP